MTRNCLKKTKEIGDKHKLQDDIDKLGNTGMNYEMGGTILSKTVKEKDLGVTMNANKNKHESLRAMQNCSV